MSIGTIREVPEPIRDAVMSVQGDADKIAWAELVGLELSGRSREVDAGVSFVSLIEGLPTEQLVDFRYLLREHFGTERPDDKESLYAVVAHLVEVLEHEIAGRWVGLGKR